METQNFKYHGCGWEIVEKVDKKVSWQKQFSVPNGGTKMPIRQFEDNTGDSQEDKLPTGLFLRPKTIFHFSTLCRILFIFKNTLSIIPPQYQSPCP